MTMTAEEAGNNTSPDHVLNRRGSGGKPPMSGSGFPRSSSIPELQQQSSNDSGSSAPSTPVGGSRQPFLRSNSGGTKRRAGKRNSSIINKLELSMDFMAPMTPRGGGSTHSNSSSIYTNNNNNNSGGMPTAPATTGGMRRRLSASLMSKVSVFDRNSDHGTTNKNNNNNNNVLTMSPGAGDPSPPGTPRGSTKQRRRESRASMLIQQFNDKAASSPLPPFGGHGSFNNDSPRENIKLLSPEQVKELVKLSSSKSQSGGLNPYMKNYNEQVNNSRSKLTLYSAPNLDDDDEEDESEEFGGEGSNTTTKNNTATAQPPPILLKPTEVKALIHANAQSKLFQLVHVWENFSQDTVAKNEPGSLSHDDDETEEDDMVPIKEQLTLQKWKQRQFAKQQQDEKEKSVKVEASASTTTNNKRASSVKKDYKSTRDRFLVSPPEPLSSQQQVRRLYAAATTTPTQPKARKTATTTTTTAEESSSTALPSNTLKVRAFPPLDMVSFVPASFPASKDAAADDLIQSTVQENFVFSEFRRNGGKARVSTTMQTLLQAFEPLQAQKVGDKLVSIHDDDDDDNDNNNKDVDEEKKDEEEEEEHFYIVQQGQVDIEVNGVIVGRAGKGDCFGEQALLHQSFAATTTNLWAVEDDDNDQETTRVLRLDHKSFRGILQSHATQAMEAKRAVIRGIDFLQPLLEQDDEAIDNGNGDGDGDNDDTLLNQLADLLTRQEFLEEETFEVEPKEQFHIVQTGTLHLENTAGRIQMDLGPGEYYGKEALLGGTTYHDENDDSNTMITMTGTSADLGVFYSMERAAMERALGENRLAQLQDWNAITQSIPLQGWMGRNDDTSSSGGRTLRKSMQQQMDSSSLKTRGRLSLLIQSKRFEEPGQNILEHEAEDDPAVYVVREGQVKVQYTDGKGTAQEKTVDVGGVFGDEHLLKAQHDDDSSPTAATISRPADYTAQVTGDGPVSVGVLPIKKIVEEQKKIEEQTVDEEELPAVPEEKDIEEAFTSKTPTAVSLSLQQKIRQAVKANVGLNDLEKIRVLGEGQYGEVWLVETDVFQTGVDTLKQRFALKSQFMTDDTRGDEARQAIGREIDILQTLTQTTPHAGIVNLVQTYQDEECIYMLMGLIPGGELWSRIHQEVSEGEWKSGMSEESAKFYTYVLADTMGFLHSQHILFRDMKPENVMLDEDGYPVLVDFGFAKRVPEGEKTFTFCGTPNYVAPEIILQSGHDKAADYWALGVTMYEMVSGENPFYYDGMDQVTLYDTIVREQFYAYSKPPSDALMDLSYQILEKEPHQRLGSLAGGTRDITKHAWFAELDSTAIRSKKLAAPWKPNSDKKVEVDEEAMEEILACFETEEESTHYDDEDNAGGLLDEEPLEELPYSIEPSFSNVAPGSFRIDEAEEEESCDELDLYDLAEENSESEHEINSDDDTIEGEMDLNTPETERETVDVLEQSHKATNDSLSVPPRSSTLSHEGKSSRKSVLSPSISPRRKANRRDREKHKKERKSTVLGALAGLGLGDSMGALGFDMDALDEKGDE